MGLPWPLDWTSWKPAPPQRASPVTVSTKSTVPEAFGLERPLVLIDSGANEIIRPLRPELESKLASMNVVQVALASGDTISAYRTADGELVVPTCGEASAEWIVPLEKLTAGIGCSFSWNGDAEGPTLRVPQSNGSFHEVNVVVKNRLPYVRWSDFQPLRKRLAKLLTSAQPASSSRLSAERPDPLPSTSSPERGVTDTDPTASPGRGSAAPSC